MANKIPIKQARDQSSTLSQNTTRESKEDYSTAPCMGTQQRPGARVATAKVNVCLGSQKAERAGLRVPVDCPESPPQQSTLGMWPSAAVWSVLAMCLISSASSCSLLIFIYSLTAGSSALSICGVTPISPSNSHSPLSSLLPYVSAITCPIQIPPLLSPKAPEPSTPPPLFICFS